MEYSLPACRGVEAAVRQGTFQRGPMRPRRRARRQDMKTRFLAQAAICLGLLGTSVLPAAIAPGALAATPGNSDPWPRTLQVDSGTLTVYQPQVDSWDGGFLKFRAALSVKPSNGGQEIFGTVAASAHTLVDKTARTVRLFNFSVLNIDFPTLADHGQSYVKDLARLLP